ncbi:MAG: hypothetical protein GC168_12280 [Candidatus Hydrogenedens sp.]|nr:hypothetical protein [Candidatus Hydrogenedens sp.]
MRYLSFAIAAIAVAALAGCGPSAKKTETSAASPELPPLTSANVGLDIGDAEHHLTVEARLATEGRAPNIAVDELIDDTKQLSLVTLTVSEPMPSSLPISFTLKSTENFGDSPVAVIGQALRDNDPIFDFTAVAGAEAHKLPQRSGGQPPAIWTVDVLEGLDSVPDTMLINARIILKMAPKGTPEADVDPGSIEVTPEFESVEFTNPVRINFEHAAETAAEPAAVESTDAEPEPAAEEAPAEAAAP